MRRISQARFCIAKGDCMSVLDKIGNHQKADDDWNTVEKLAD